MALEMNNEEFENYAEKFRKKFGYLPCGKDDPLRPGVEYVLIDLSVTWQELAQTRTELERLRGKIEKEIKFLRTIYKYNPSIDFLELANRLEHYIRREVAEIGGME